MEFRPFENKVWLATPTMHGDELRYVTEAYETNWMSTVGANINEVEKIAAEKAEMKYAVGLSCCTAALHLAVKHAGETLYGKPAISHGALEGRRIFCSDMTFDATLNPVVYEGGIPVFIDTEAESWNMDPVALEKAFEMYPASPEEWTKSRESARSMALCSLRMQQKLWVQPLTVDSVVLSVITPLSVITATKLSLALLAVAF